MKRILFALALMLVAALPALAKEAKSTGKASEWGMNATIIEACSCPMFCSCYFGSGHPAGHHDPESHAEEHFCRFNNAIKVNKGHYKDVNLDGVKFWVAGDLGADFGSGEADWAVVTFDKSLSQAQRDGIVAIVAKLYPAKFKSLTTDEGDISWVAGSEESHAMIDGGKTAEVALRKGGFGQMGKTPVIRDLQYWGANSNTGFVLMPNTVEAYRVGDKPFEFKDTNGFMITFDIHAETPAPSGGKGGGE
jgi:hypothetical protein